MHGRIDTNLLPDLIESFESYFLHVYFFKLVQLFISSVGKVCENPQSSVGKVLRMAESSVGKMYFLT